MSKTPNHKTPCGNAKAEAHTAHPGSGNVFADLNLPDSNELLAKTELARQIGLLIDKAGLTQTQAAAALGIDQPKVSALLRGKLADFSTERLIRFLNALGQDVEIVVRPRTKSLTRQYPPLRVVSRKQYS